MSTSMLLVIIIVLQLISLAGIFMVFNKLKMGAHSNPKPMGRGTEGENDEEGGRGSGSGPKPMGRGV